MIASHRESAEKYLLIDYLYVIPLEHQIETPMAWKAVKADRLPFAPLSDNP